MLYLVPTPIGNLNDMTPRAIEVLGMVSFILAEDTRNSGILLKHFGIQTPMRSYHAHNEHRIVEKIIEELRAEEKDVALITDAGTPAISDPGFLLVRACHDAGIKVSCLPGASAVIAALAMSGLPSDRFYFEGFLPQKKGRQTRWKYLSKMDCTIVLYESPHRIQKCVEEISEYLNPQRKVVLAKEISKLYETLHRGSAEELVLLLKSGISLKGEWVVVIGAQAEE